MPREEDWGNLKASWRRVTASGDLMKEEVRDRSVRRGVKCGYVEVPRIHDVT